jgi:anti-sigma B factor antagonist
MKFTYEIHNQIIFLNLNGDIIGSSLNDELIQLIESTLNSNIILCAIDISKVRFINSSGIGLLISILTRFRNKGGEVFLVNPSGHVKKLLIITKLNAIFNIVDSKNEAIEKLTKI